MFLRGRPTSRVTAEFLYAIFHGLVAIGLIGFVLIMVFRSAFFVPEVRLVFLITVGVCAAILVVSRLRVR